MSEHLEAQWMEGVTSDGQDGWDGFFCPRCHTPDSLYGTVACFERKSHGELEAALAAAEQRAGDALDINQKILDWCDAYPVDVFEPPAKEDYARAHEVLKEAGLSGTALFADTMRHVIDGVRNLAEASRAALNRLEE